MKINKQTLVALFSSIGRIADDWDNKTLAERARQIPTKFTEDKMEEKEHLNLYQALAKLPADEEIEIVEVGKPASGPVDLEGMERSELIAFAASKGIEVDRKKNTQELRTRIAHALKSGAPAAKPAKAEKATKAEKAPKADKPAKAPKATPKEEKAPKAPKEPAKPKRQPPVKDKFGNRVNTIAAKVNSVVTRSWKTEDDIIKDSGLKKIEVRGRLYHAVRNGIYEVERVIRYRIAPDATKE